MGRTLPPTTDYANAVGDGELITWVRKLVDRCRCGDGAVDMDLRIQCLCADTADPTRLAGFREAALGWRRTYERGDEIVLEPMGGVERAVSYPTPVFLRNNDVRAGKNRFHLGLRTRDQAAEVTRLESWAHTARTWGKVLTSAGS
jgi:hypothetical protein